MFSLNQLDRLREPAIEKALEDRHRFDIIYVIIEKYIKKKNLIIGGEISIKKAIGLPRDKDDFSYIVYSEHPVRDGFEISNKIAEHTNAVYMRTDLYGKELSVKVQDRPLVQIVGLPKNMRQIISPIDVDGLLYVPPDYHLLQMYRLLYLPIPDDWEETMKYEKQLQEWLQKEYKTNSNKFIGGRSLPFDRVELKKQLFKHLKTQEVVFVGPDAAETLVKKELDISSNSALYIVAKSDYSKEIKLWIQQATKLPVIVKKSGVQLLTDFRLERYTISIVHDSNTIPVLYMYNSLDYDLVPYVKLDDDSIKIGNIFVVLRFVLIDIWIIKVIRSFGGMPEHVAKPKIIENYDILFKLRKHLDIDDKNIAPDSLHNLYGIFQKPNDSNYLGQYYSDRNAKKELIKSTKYVPDYLPVRYKKEHGHYQSLENTKK